MSTSGFRSAGLGVQCFTYGASCSPGCNATNGHARDCGGVVGFVQMDVVRLGEPASTFVAGGSFTVFTIGPSCPHCGGSLVVNGIAAAPPATDG